MDSGDIPDEMEVRGGLPFHEAGIQVGRCSGSKLHCIEEHVCFGSCGIVLFESGSWSEGSVEVVVQEDMREGAAVF